MYEEVFVKWITRTRVELAVFVNGKFLGYHTTELPCVTICTPSQFAVPRGNSKGTAKCVFSPVACTSQGTF